MGLGNSSGLSHPLCVRSAPEAAAETVVSLERGRSASGGRNPGHVRKRATQESQMKGRGFVSNFFLVPKKDRGDP